MIDFVKDSYNKKGVCPNRSRTQRLAPQREDAMADIPTEFRSPQEAAECVLSVHYCLAARAAMFNKLACIMNLAAGRQKVRKR
jgi:hypothetical protein